MSDIKLFRFAKDKAEELGGRSALVERELHDLMEKHMECFLGIRFVAHEYSTGKNHRGRIDSLGLDENCCPVIIEYKRQTNENVINQGLYYLDWLLDHQAEFKLLVMERFGKEEADALEWGGTRVLCVAGDFTKYDEHAVAQIGRNIELIRYKYFSDDLLLLEWLNPVQERGGSRQSTVAPVPFDDEVGQEENSGKKAQNDTNTFAEHFAAMPSELRLLYDELYSFIMSLGDDINAKELRLYLAFSRLKNFVCLLPMKSGLKLWVKLDPATVQLEKDFSRDVSKTGHWGTGDLEIYIRNKDDFAKAKPLIERAYQEN
ncbi:DUF5655 domain-containing protein [Desulfobulbus sp.]|uniref:DUF5655 domain-containing protein n=1 Tax=Desulfobulbus sp. TaxID=895 RepID=UPI00286F6554|nr:DUF5655 domain-containing protein [Desulfobulbus sp.]